MSSPPKHRRGPWGDGPPPTREEMDRRLEEASALCLEHVKANAERGNPASVVEVMDEFAKTRHIMNIGVAKGAIIDEEIRKKQPAIMAELGGFTGYSAVRFASVQREVMADRESHYYSFEFNPAYAARIREVVDFAGLSEQVTVFEGPFSERYHELDGKTVDIYFIDHDKSAYLSDTKLILDSKTLVPGSVLAADNVSTPGAKNFVEFIENSSEFSVVMHTIRFGWDNELRPDLAMATYLG